ncbi:MAG TPA: MBL fold metallo-hydrolase [Pirellulales bacterium]|nr:MBL fold metallo-hydrolase [Pirellulales bacterium]
MNSDKIQIETIISAPFEENSYVVYFPGRNDCLVIDPGLAPQEIIDCLDERGLQPAAILLTHGHADHIAGNRALKNRWPACPIVIGRGDAPKLTDARLNLSAQYGLPLTSPPADAVLDDGDRYSAAGFDFDVYEIPGHSCGHIVFVWRGGERVVVFGGDVLFSGSIGRSDFPDGSFEQLARGIHQKLFSLPDDSIVFSGHGPPTTIGEEKRTNPFVGRPAGYQGGA